MHTKEQRELRRLPAVRVGLRGRHAKFAAVALVFLATIAATSRITLDLNRWRDAGAAARSAAASEGTAERARIEAQLVMRRDICAGIQVLRANAKRDDSVGIAARNALAMIDEELR